MARWCDVSREALTAGEWAPSPELYLRIPGHISTTDLTSPFCGCIQAAMIWIILGLGSSLLWLFIVLRLNVFDISLLTYECGAQIETCQHMIEQHQPKHPSTSSRDTGAPGARRPSRSTTHKSRSTTSGSKKHEKPTSSSTRARNVTKNPRGKPTGVTSAQQHDSKLAKLYKELADLEWTRLHTSSYNINAIQLIPVKLSKRLIFLYEYITSTCINY